MTIYDEAVLLTKQMTLSEKVLLLEHLSSVLKQELVTEAYRHLPWEQFLELTYGSLAHDPIERNQPMHSDTRDDTSRVPTHFDFNDWLTESNALQHDIQSELQPEAFVGSLALLAELREES